MSHTYLIDLYGLIEQRLQEVKDEIEKQGSSGEKLDLLQGRAASLIEFKQFLKSGYDMKLPRRLRGKA
jgi:hypothetical protein